MSSHEFKHCSSDVQKNSELANVDSTISSDDIYSFLKITYIQIFSIFIYLINIKKTPNNKSYFNWYTII